MSDVNPKDIQGAKKLDLSLFPPVAHLHGAHAFVDGAAKYGPYNWREKKVRARVYVAAAMRHLHAWLDGEELAVDSRCHHLGHVIACCAILLDAQENGALSDDRPVKGGAQAVMDRLAATVQDRITQSWADAALVDQREGAAA